MDIQCQENAMRLLPQHVYSLGNRSIGFSWHQISINRIKKQSYTCFNGQHVENVPEPTEKLVQKTGRQTDKLSISVNFWSPYDCNQSLLYDNWKES